MGAAVFLRMAAAWSLIWQRLSCCSADQVLQEVSAVLRMLDEAYRVFGLTYKMALSTRPEGYLGTLDMWDRAEAALTEALDSTGQPWEVRAPAESLLSGLACGADWGDWDGHAGDEASPQCLLQACCALRLYVASRREVLEGELSDPA